MFQTLMFSELTFDTMSERAQVLACAVMHSCARACPVLSVCFLPSASGKAAAAVCVGRGRRGGR
jgi:hypothetical protein